MNELLLLLGAATIVAVGVALSYPSMRTSVRGALGIMLLLFILSPLFGVLEGLRGLDFALPEYGADTDRFDEITLAAFEEGVSVAVSEKYGIDSSTVAVRARGFLPTDMRADGITVVLPEEARGIDYRAVREYIAENFTRGGACEVVYG